MARVGHALAVSLCLCAGGSAYGACDPQATIHERPLGTAWWLRIRFPACDTAILGIPAGKIDSRWLRAAALKKEHVPKSALLESGRDALEAGRRSFELAGDFNGDGARDYALVGVYVTKDDETGRFLLIATEQKPDVWAPVFLESIPGEPGFLALGRSGTKIQLWNCLECDAVSTLEWSAKQKKYAWTTAATPSAGESCKEFVGWLIYPSEKGSPSAQELRCAAGARWELRTGKEEVLAHMTVPARSKGQTFNYGSCKIDGVARDDVIAAVRHEKGKEWSRAVDKAWLIDPKRREFRPIAPAGLECRNEGYGL